MLQERGKVPVRNPKWSRLRTKKDWAVVCDPAARAQENPIFMLNETQHTSVSVLFFTNWGLKLSWWTEDSTEIAQELMYFSCMQLILDWSLTLYVSAPNPHQKESGLSTCKAKSLPSILSLQPQLMYLQIWGFKTFSKDKEERNSLLTDY